MITLSLIKRPIISTLLITLVTSLSACTALQKTNVAKAIEKNRQSILTSADLSDATLGMVLASGINQEQCLADFDTCIDKVNHAFMGGNHRNHLLTLAELYYAHAKHLKNMPNCQAKKKPPIKYTLYQQNTTYTQDKDNASCLTTHRHALFHALRYSYVYLFYDELIGVMRYITPVVGEGHILAQDLYHASIHHILQEVYLGDSGSFAFSKKYPQSQLPKDYTPPNIEHHHHDLMKFYQIDSVNPDNTINQLHFYIAKDTHYLDMIHQDTPDGIKTLDSMYESRLSGINVVSTRSGLGVGYIGSLNNRYQSTLPMFNANKRPKTKPSNPQLLNSDPKERIYPMQHLLLTGIITPTGQTLEDVLSTTQFDVQFYNPYTTYEINRLGFKHPLYANFSSVYAKWLSENQFRQVGIANMLSRNAKLPELFMLEPYDPNKKVIIMIHGLASSPHTWVNLTNNLLADPKLRQHYQVWQIFYSTNLPILENRYQIHQLLTSAFKENDKTGKNAASHHAVIIGHSMGGIIARLLLSDDNLLLRLDTLGNQAPQASDDNAQTPSPLANHADIKKLLSRHYHQDFDQRFKLSALPQISTAVFISSPHRGTDYADRWFPRAVRHIIHLPLDITQSITSSLADIANADTIANHSLGSLYLQNGASQLSDKSAFVELTQDITISPNVQYHSIIANNTGDKKAVGDTISDTLSDGVVPYTSSYLEGASSETILTGGHSIQSSPQTVLHLRTILHKHLENLEQQPTK